MKLELLTPVSIPATAVDCLNLTVSSLDTTGSSKEGEFRSGFESL